MASGSKGPMDDNEISYLSSLTNDGRAHVLQQWLVQWGYPVILHPWHDPSALNGYLVPGIALLKRLAAYEGKGRLDLMSEAKVTFYGQNVFLVWLDGLQHFISGAITGGTEVGNIVRNVTIRINISDYKKHGKTLVTELENLFRFEKANCLTLEIFGEGTLEGSDLKTQQLIQDICSTVKRLINSFGTRFNIQKGSAISPLLPSSKFCRLTSYWDPPQDSTRQRVCSGGATFKDLMQVQVESWLADECMLPDKSCDEPKDNPNHEGIADPWNAQHALDSLFGDAKDGDFFKNYILSQEWSNPPALDCILPQENLSCDL